LTDELIRTPQPVKFALPPKTTKSFIFSFVVCDQDHPGRKTNKVSSVGKPGKEILERRYFFIKQVLNSSGKTLVKPEDR